MRAGKTNDGVVVFDVPPEFNPDHRPVKVTYQPTRWGGAKRVEALLPPGLGLRPNFVRAARQTRDVRARVPGRPAWAP